MAKQLLGSDLERMVCVWCKSEMLAFREAGAPLYRDQPDKDVHRSRSYKYSRCRQCI